MSTETAKEGPPSPSEPASPGQHPAPPGATAQAPVPPYPYAYPPYQYPAAPPQRTKPGIAGWLVAGVIAAIALVGLMIAIAAAVIGGFVASNLGLIERTANSTNVYAVGGAPSVVITDPAGSVTFQRGTDNQVTVQVTKHARGNTSSAANTALANMVVDESQSGNTITITAQLNRTNLGATGGRSVDLIITVPAQTNLSLQLGAGSVVVRQVSGAITLSTGAGSVTLQDATLSGVSRLSTGAGTIEWTGAIASGASVSVHSGAGNITVSLPASTPAHVEASTGVGNLTITGWPITPSNAGGVSHRASGDLSANPSATLTMDVGAGNVTLRQR